MKESISYRKYKYNLLDFRHIVCKNFEEKKQLRGKIVKMNNTLEPDLSPIQKQTLTCFDSDLLRDVIKGASFDLHQVGQGSFRADIFHASFGKGILDSARYSNSILTEGTVSQDNMTFGFIHNCRNEFNFNGNILQKHDVLMGDEGGPLSSCIPADTHWSSFQFKRNDLLKLGMKLEKDNSKIFHFNKKMQEELSFKLGGILDYLEKENDEKIARINKELLYHHILGIYANALEHTKDISYLKRDESLFLSKKIRTYLNDHAVKPIQMIELTALTGKSERTVERIFKKYFGITPYTYLKIHRLHLIRNQLLQMDESVRVNIGDIAIKNGFMQMGYFGSEYKKIFGETASATLRRK
jgi:AraC family ethanolamine operon transcriptional activator